MKSSRNIAVFFVVAIAIIGFWQLPEQNIDDSEISESDLEVVKLDQQQLEVENQQSSQVEEVNYETPVDTPLHQDQSTSQEELTTSQSNAKTSTIKAYEDDWCDGNTELSEEDLLFAQSELINWHKTIGNVSIHNPNHELASYVAAYKDLPIEELQSLALEGDKWAMVAYVQDSRVDDEQKPQYKNRIAKRLMVQGESYYAIGHLVSKLMGAAMIEHVTKGEEAAINRLSDALAYMYWGLEHYNHGGVRPFLSYTDGREIFGEELPLEVALAKAEEKAKYKLSVLINRTNKKRAEAGIDFPEPPKVMETVFSHLVAFWHLTDGKSQLDLLRSLDIPTNKRIAVTPCTEKAIEVNTKHSS